MEWWKTSTSTRTLTLSCRKNTPNLKKNELNEWKMNEMKISFHFNYFILLWLELNNRSNNNMKNNKTVHRKTFKKKKCCKKVFRFEEISIQTKNSSKIFNFLPFFNFIRRVLSQGWHFKNRPWSTVKNYKIKLKTQIFRFENFGNLLPSNVLFFGLFYIIFKSPKAGQQTLTQVLFYWASIWLNNRINLYL